MITAIFNKSKPINLVITTLLVVLGFTIANFKIPQNFSWNHFLLNIGVVLLAVFSTLLVDFIVKKNAISEQNSYVVLFYSIFFFCFWSQQENYYLLVSNVFVLLALRKIISLKTQTNTTKKIFDAALWICVASLFHYWAILFFIVLYLGITLYSSDYYKNWLVPIISVFVVFIIAYALQLITSRQWFSFEKIIIERGFHEFNSPINIATISFFSALLIIAVTFLSPSVKQKLQKNKLSYVVLLFALLIAVIILLLAPHKNNEMLVYVYFPLAALFTVVYEQISKKWLQTSLLYVIFLASITLCFLSS